MSVVKAVPRAVLRILYPSRERRENGPGNRKSTSAAVKAMDFSPTEANRLPRQKPRMANGATVRTVCGLARGNSTARYSAGPSHANRTRIPRSRKTSPLGVRTPRNMRRRVPRKCNRRRVHNAIDIIEHGPTPNRRAAKPAGQAELATAASPSVARKNTSSSDASPLTVAKAALASSTRPKKSRRPWCRIST